MPLSNKPQLKYALEQKQNSRRSFRRLPVWSTPLVERPWTKKIGTEDDIIENKFWEIGVVEEPQKKIKRYGKEK